jgi:hypothetical protein
VQQSSMWWLPSWVAWHHRWEAEIACNQMRSDLERSHVTSHRNRQPNGGELQLVLWHACSRSSMTHCGSCDCIPILYLSQCSSSALRCGSCLQEVIKLVTGQFTTLSGSLVYNAVGGATSCFEL